MWLGRSQDEFKNNEKVISSSGNTELPKIDIMIFRHGFEICPLLEVILYTIGHLGIV